MWTQDWRSQFEAAAERAFDVLIVGGGITGAGVALQAARAGLRVALIEQNDFASGTSSWSSKLVHGGLRYLASGDWRLTRESVQERQRLMHDLPGLVTPLDFMLPVYAHDKPGRWALQAALGAYDFMARKRYSHYMKPAEFGAHMPYLNRDGLKGGFVYRDALTDDVRLTLRVLIEARSHGVLAANYVRAEQLLFDGDTVNGARVADRETGRCFDIRAAVVVNATGPWSDRLRAQVEGAAQLRPLRGSHFVFPFHVLPVGRAITLFHPDDRRPLFAIPWQGATVFGTTDLDHEKPMDEVPRMSAAESDYLIAAARHYFPARNMQAADALSCFAGVRPIVRGEPGASASQESRESSIERERGLITVTGGKLTTFRVTANDVLEQVGQALGRRFVRNDKAPIIHAVGADAQTRGGVRHGPAFAGMFARADDARALGTTDYRFRELRFALSHEAVAHLDDLLLRRTRAGLLLEQGGLAELPALEPLVRDTLGWDAARWNDEVERYRAHWHRVHAPV
ncbi:glycerol-3-phosphate dehydrogenase/oxidase [uncultured Salinisphaera sp.]|uniref:glycerol-3-phosphate dehydrogenase/oxidase n=1 Tax=uncultured Salinisphaera sp. TaxID=359372 RepID=UPI0032B2FF6C